MLYAATASAQIYVLKDHRDTTPIQEFYDSLPVMADSFFQDVLLQDTKIIKLYTPSIKHLKSTFDTLDIDYNIADVALKQQIIRKKLERTYSKILKRAEKRKLTFRRYTLEERIFNYGESEDGYEYCYVTYKCKKKKKEMTVSYLAIRLNGYWFLGDELDITIL